MVGVHPADAATASRYLTRRVCRGVADGEPPKKTTEKGEHMAYAEKRGKGPRPWRVKYKLPSGSEASESGFETKQSALDWGRDQEAKIRAGTWTDPNAGKITVNDWIDRWLAVQDVGLSTESNREYLIRRFLRPQWGSRTLDSLTGEEITAWENALPTSLGISRRTARDARSLLCTILGDAAAAKPALIPYNDSDALASASMAALADTCSTPRTAAITAAATSPGGCSARPATGATNR